VTEGRANPAPTFRRFFMEEKILGSFMSSGFAACVACFVLLRLERELKELRRAIEKLARCQVCFIEEKITECGAKE